MSQGRRLLALGVAASLALVACGSNSSSASPAASTAASAGAASAGAASAGTSAAPAAAKKMIPKLVIDNESGAAWNCQFNPLNTSDNWYTTGYLYEPLFYINSLQSNPDGSPKTTPWLATAYSWNTDQTQVTFTIRQGVKWSDGQDLHRGRRGLHVQRPQERRRRRHPGPLDGRQRQAHDRGEGQLGPDQGGLHLRQARGHDLLLPSRPAAHRPAAHLRRVGRRPDQARDPAEREPGGHRPVHHGAVRRNQHEVPAQHRPTGRARRTTSSPRSRKSTTRHS